MSLKIALPKGKLLTPTAELLQKAGWDIDGYNQKLCNYRLQSGQYPDLKIKVFQEKDIPIQVAFGNYDLGICGQDWIEELLVKYPSSAIVKIADLGYGEGALYAAAMPEKVKAKGDVTRIAGEYPNLAESLAEQLRLKRFSIFPVWGAAEAYPPEDAELVLLPGKTAGDIAGCGLEAISRIVGFRAYLIANRESLKAKDMAELLSSLTDDLIPAEECRNENDVIQAKRRQSNRVFSAIDNDTLRLALPDGHQQRHVKRIFEAAGIKVEDYPSESGNRRPSSNMDGVFIKVIRPQDMPLQIANDNFDLAITGKDWLTEHRLQFPSSPVIELMDLKYGWVKIVAVVSNEVAADDITGWQRLCSQSKTACRVASEYINIADNYAREKRLGRYRIIPTWGATEAFLPEDADLLIENTETGGTIDRHNLKIIDTLFESTACLIGSKKRTTGSVKKERMGYIIEALKSATDKIE
jgi:ATP phosphoribosyltransferase